MATNLTANPQIENLEKTTHDVLRHLRSLRNMLRPVNRFPPEIISFIARCVLEDIAVDSMSIIPLTHVCQYWRNCITSMPENWSLICSERLELAELSLERAKAAPLTVFNLLGLSRVFVDLLQPHIQNIVSFTCAGFSSMEELAHALSHFPKLIPGLRLLFLAAGRPRADWSYPVDPFDFSANTKLRELSLSYVPLLPSILSLRTLTMFSLCDRDFQLPLDTLLSFLEENRSLESATLMITFVEPSLSRSQRQTPIKNKLKYLSIESNDTTTIRALASSIALQKGGTLEISHSGNNGGSASLISGVSTSNLSIISSPTFMEYRYSFGTAIKLLGPSGSFSHNSHTTPETPFEEFPILQLSSIRELRLQCRGPRTLENFYLSFFPSLEILAIDGCSSVSFLSPVLPDPSSSPSLKTLAFLDCDIAEDFLAHLAQIAVYREKLTLTSLHRVVIIDSKREFPSAAAIEWLRECIPVVEVLEGKGFPTDLS